MNEFRKDTTMNGFRKEEMKKEKKALFTVYQRVDDATFERITPAKSSHQAWTLKLLNKFK